MPDNEQPLDDAGYDMQEEDVTTLLEGGEPAPPSPQAQEAELFNQRLNLESIPEGLRGKSIGEMIQRQVAMEDALRMSERARQDLISTVGMVRNQPVQQAPPVEVPRQLSKEEYAELMQNDPMAAVEYMIAQRGGEFMQHVEHRLAPLGNAAAVSAERTARDKYALEFELFGDQIKSIYDQAPNKSAFTNQQVWDDMISFVRGRPDNITKYIGAVTKNGGAAARQREADAAGVNLTNSGRPVSVGAGGWEGADATTVEIAKNLGFSSLAEYKKWM